LGSSVRRNFLRKNFLFSLKFDRPSADTLSRREADEVADKAGQIGRLVRTMGFQLRDAVTGALGLAAHDFPPARSHRSLVVDQVSRNAVAELVNQAKNQPQRGDLASANPAYVALAELSQIFGFNGLALGLKHETGEIGFLDLSMSLEAAAARGGAYLERSRNRIMWRQLKKLTNAKVDRTMLGPRKPVVAPDQMPDDSFFDELESAPRP
jgi:hypothetical protein